MSIAVQSRPWRVRRSTTIAPTVNPGNRIIIRIPASAAARAPPMLSVEYSATSAPAIDSSAITTTEPTRNQRLAQSDRTRTPALLFAPTPPTPRAPRADGGGEGTDPGRPLPPQSGFPTATRRGLFELVRASIVLHL